MKKMIVAVLFMLTASQAFGQYSTGMIGNQPFMMYTFQNGMGSYSTGMVGGQSFGITTFGPPPADDDDNGFYSMPAPPPPPFSQSYTQPTDKYSSIPDKWRERWNQCSDQADQSHMEMSCISDMSRIVVWLYIAKNAPVSSELNDCQQRNYANANPDKCFASILDYFSRL